VWVRCEVYTGFVGGPEGKRPLVKPRQKWNMILNGSSGSWMGEHVSD
jgi:hypothetical protein